MKHRNFLNVIFCVALATSAIACSETLEPPMERKFGTPFGAGASAQNAVQLHAADTEVSACERLFELKGDDRVSDVVSTFAYASNFAIDNSNANAPRVELTTSAKSNPLVAGLLASSRVQAIANSPDEVFLDMAKVTIRVKACKAEDAASWTESDGCRFEWEETLGEYGCSYAEAGPTNGKCLALWQRYVAKKGIGACAHVADGAEPGSPQCQKAAGLLGMLNQFQQNGQLFMAKNMFISAKFRGVFGAAGAPYRSFSSAEQSLLYGILSRVADFTALGADRVNEIVSANLPMFPEDRSWASFQADMFRSLSAVKNSTFAGDRQEQLCAIILGHRSFAQLLDINGYGKPVLNDAGDVAPIVPGSGLPVIAQFGGYLRENPNDRGTFLPAVITPQDLKAYDPRAGLILPAQYVPGLGAPTPSDLVPANLSARLDRLVAIEYLYEATSPAAGWRFADNQNLPYWLGDIEDTSSAAVLPPKMHSLALGHLVLGFKNLAALNIRMVKADGGIVLPGEENSAAGVVLVDEFDRTTLEGVMDAENLMKFSEMILRLDDALRKVFAVENLGLVNSSYGEDALPALRGLAGRVNALKLPLRFALEELMNSANGCIGKVRMRLAPGIPAGQRVQPLARCTASQLAKFNQLKDSFAASLLPTN